MKPTCSTCRLWFPNTKEVYKMYRQYASMGQCERTGEVTTPEDGCKYHDFSETTIEDWYFNNDSNSEDDL